MNSKMNFVAVLAIILLVIGAAFASGILTFSFGASKETNESVFSMASKSSKGLVGQPLDFKVEHFEVEPYKGPYSYQWDFGDGTVEDGTNVTTHTFMSSSEYHVQILVGGSGGWSHLLDAGSIMILDQDAFNVSILNMGHCDWNMTYEGDLFLNFTLWNHATYPVDICKRSFGLYNGTGGSIQEIDNQTDVDAIVPAGGNVTWTIFFAADQDIPTKFAYYNLFEWTIDWRES